MPMREIALINPEQVTQTETLSYKVRETGRAIVLDKENNIALLHARNNHYYKLPGGGIEEGEDTIAALRRECLEEIGCEIEVMGELGQTLEYRKKYSLKQTSFCFIAKVTGEKGTPALTEDEIEEGFETVWLPYGQALEVVSKSTPTIYEGQFMVARDTALLRAYSERVK